MTALLLALTLAGPADDLLFRARHAQLVQGAPRKAVALYEQALRAIADEGRQASVRLRIAACWVELKQYDRAEPYLEWSIYARAPAEQRKRVRALRAVVAESRPKHVAVERKPARDRNAATHLRAARSFLEAGDLVRAFIEVQAALDLDPNDAGAKSLEDEIETQLSGVTRFVKDPLQFLRKWTAAGTRAVAGKAQKLLREAVRSSAFNVAERRFRDAIEVIDACEFRQESDELIELRHRIVARWRKLRAKQLGPRQADPQIRDVPLRSSYRTDHLRHLQLMLDVISTQDSEFRIVPLTRRLPDEARLEWRARPQRFLLRNPPSRWSPALFARHYLPLRVFPGSWSQGGHYLEAAGGMLVAHNTRPALDALQEAVRRIEKPRRESWWSRFLLVSVPAGALGRFEEQFGGLADGDGGLRYRVVPPHHPLVRLADFFRDEGSDLRLARDLFEVKVQNGLPQTYFAAVHLSEASGYEKAQPTAATDYGLLLDTYPLRDAAGRTAMLMRLSSRFPAAPLRTQEGAATPRFLTQEAEIYVDLEPGGTLVVAGLVDPFAAGHGEHAATSAFLLVWTNPGDGGAAAAGDEPAPGTVDVAVRDLLLNVARDRPGPRRDLERGFVRRERVEILRERTRFLEALLRDGLGSQEVAIDVEEAVVRVPASLRERATELVEQLERQSRRSYVVRVEARAVRTQHFQRWMKKERLELRAFGEAHLALSDAPSSEFLLRSLVRTEPGDVFSPRAAWPAVTVLGLQARHALSSQTRTSPAYATDDELARGETRTVTQGLRVTVRPYHWRGSLRAWVEVETAGLESEVEELSLAQAVPSYKTTISGTRAAGTVDFGPVAHPRTALICRIPHPTASTTKRLTEIVVAVSVHPVP